MGRKVSPAEYARHRGVSKAAVTYAMRDGRIPIEIDKATGKRLIDVEAADQAWRANTRHDKRVNGLGNQPALEESPTAAVQVPPAPAATTPAPAPEEPATRAPAIATSRAVREAFLAKLSKIEYEERIGKLLPADETEKRWLTVANLVRTKVLGLSTRARQRMPELTDSQVATLEIISREILEDLADG